MKLHYLAVACALFAVTACVDEGFRLDEVSKEIMVGGGTTTLPLGYLDKQRLGDLITVEDIEGLSVDANGNYSLSFEGEGDEFSIDGIDNTFDIDKTVTTFSTSYPAFNITGDAHIINRPFYITPDFKGLDIPYDVPIPIPAGYTITAEEEGSVSEHLEYSVPHYLAAIKRIYLKPQKAGDKGACIDMKFKFRDLAAINGGGHITMELMANDGYELYGKDGKELEVVDHQGHTTTYQIAKNQAFAAGTEEIEFVVYVASIANESVVENNTLSIPVELGYHVSFDITSRATTLRMKDPPALHMDAALQYQDADIVLNEVMLLEHGSFDGEATTISFDDLPEEVKSINRVNFSDHSPMHLMAEGLDWIEDTTAEHIIVEAKLPDYLTLHDDQHHGYDAATHTLRTSLSDLRHKIDINLDALTFAGNGLEPKNGVLTLDFTPDIAAYIEAGTEAKLSTILHDEDIVFSAGIDATTLELVSLEGKIGYQYQESTSIEFDDLKGDIDFSIDDIGLSPIINIQVENPLTIAANVAASLIPVVDGVEQHERAINIDDITIQAANVMGGEIVKHRTTITIVDESFEGVLPDVGEPKIECNLSNLLQGTLPDELRISLTLSTDENDMQTIYIADSYTVSYDYDVNIPIVFNDKLDLTIDETIDGLDSFEDLAEQNIVLGDITLIMDVANTMPLDFEYDAELLDAQGKPTAVQLVIPDSYNKILGSKDGVSEAKSTLRIGLRIGNGGNLNQLADVYAIHFRLHASRSSEGSAALNAEQYISLNTKLEVKGGIKIDFDDINE